MRRKARIALVVAVGVLAACDRTPTDPARDDLSFTLLGGTSQNPLLASSPTSLHQLLRSALSKAEAEHGGAASRRLLGGWLRLNEEAQLALKAGDRHTAHNKIASVRREEIRIVLSVLGASTAHRVVSEVGVDFAHARIALGRAGEAGKDVRRIMTLAGQVSETLQRGNRALGLRDYSNALDYATQASDLLEAVNRQLISVNGIRSLEMLFTEAMAKSSDAEATPKARTLVNTLHRLNEAARGALRSGDRVGAQAKLEAARKQQISIVLEIHGPAVVGTMISDVDTGIRASRERIASIKDERIAQRATRMLSEAASLNARARISRAAGDYTSSLDLASHAAGLVNTLQHFLPR